jgi:hypothetical protein
MSVGCMHNSEYACIECQAMQDSFDKRSSRIMLKVYQEERERDFQELLRDVCPSLTSPTK